MRPRDGVPPGPATAGRLDQLEAERIALQAELDRQKPRGERNRLGQFATPTALARDILAYAATLLAPDAAVRFLDPAVGTGAFPSALLATVPDGRIEEALGFEIDPHYGAPARRLWAGSGLSLAISDFTRARPRPRFNLLVCNPPYVRHHHLSGEEKARLRLGARQACGSGMPGLSGLHCYFMAFALAWLAEGAVAGWLIPGEVLDVNYGEAVKRLLLERVTLLDVHRFDPANVQFDDALVSSAVVFFRNAPPPAGHAVRFSAGGSLLAPARSRLVPAEALAGAPKWSRVAAGAARGLANGPTLGDLFTIRRGIATGGNRYFVLDEAGIAARGLPLDAFRPILPGPRHLAADVVEADADGVPLLERRLFLLDPRLPEDEIARRHPALDRYLAQGRAEGIVARYLCRHRTPWYRQEDRPPAPILCTYLGRADARGGRPFRFILNRSRATVANVYLALYPTPALARRLADDPGLIRPIWQELNALAPGRLLGAGRVYGGGLHKLEPRELAGVPVPELASFLHA